MRLQLQTAQAVRNGANGQNRTDDPRFTKALKNSDILAQNWDLFTTSLKLAGAEIPADRLIDGVDIAPILFGTGPGQREVFFYYRGTQLYAARKGQFKAHFITRSGYGADGPVVHTPPALYDLGHDPGERFDVAAAHPDVLAQIATETERHRATVKPAKNQLEDHRPSQAGDHWARE